MMRVALVSILLIVLISACNLPVAELPVSSETSSAPTKPFATTESQATDVPVAKEPDLGHHPLYWFGPLPPLPVVEGRLFTGSDDFIKLFEPYAPWQKTSGNIQVFKLYGEWVFNHQGDAQLEKVVADLNRRGLAIAVETGPLDPVGCGEGIEGFATVNSGLQMARAIKTAGGTLHFIALDEPYYFGHFYDGPNACHWSAEKIAGEVDEFIKAVRTVFPNIIVGDTEPLAGPAGAKAYSDWLDTFYKVNGYHLAFLHMDIDWSRPKWNEEVKVIQEHGSQIGVPVGIIYNGNAADKTDEDFLSATGERVKKLELVTGVQPDHVIFQSWSDKPDRALPETEPYTFTGFINQYFTDKTGLGYKREGEGANLALGRPVRFSSQTGDLTGSLAVDGDFGTLWNSGGGPTQWIEIDLGAEFAISEIRLSVSQYPEGRTVHQVKGRSADGQFVLLQTFDGMTHDGDELLFKPDAPLTGIRFIRIETIVSPSWVAWREIEVMGE
ncbi:MAG: discoidin domain-containing protein [Anaerolineales bacterium]|nr:MAG: discoidin domain-containing protein [Anaerolineales bacterium]